MAELLRDILRVKNVELPYRIILEKRRSVRVSIAAKAAYLRLPLGSSKSQIHHQHLRFLHWAKKQLEKNEDIKKRFIIEEFRTYRHIQVMNKVFSIRTSIRADRKNRRVAIDKEMQEVELILTDKKDYQNISRILSQSFSKAYLNEIKNEVEQINSNFFNFDYQNIRLKYNATNWGSCSKKRNINLSSRLLLVPDEVRHYVIVHELAHLQEMNHSKQFWNLVHNALPNYEEYENWLKNKGRSIDFK